MLATVTTFKDFVGNSSTGIIGLINTVVVPLIFAFIFFVFVWGVIKYFFLSMGNEEKRKEGKQFVMWGFLGMAILFSIWGLISILLSTLGIAPGS